MKIFIIALLAITVIPMFYYRLRVDIILAQHDKLRLIPPRFGSESIKIFVSIIENEPDPKIQGEYISIYNGIKYSRWATLISVAITFLSIVLIGQ